MNNLRKLQSGTDIRGIAIEHDDIKINLGTKEVSKIVSGFFFWLKKNNNKISIAVGCDSRLSGEVLKDCAIKTLKDLGVVVYDCGIATTPAMFMTTVMDKYNCTGSIMITASHLPYYYNGMKFFTKNGGCEKEDITKIIELSQEQFNSQKEGVVEKINLIEDYSKILINKIKNSADKCNKEQPLEGLRIVVDAGNGAGGFFAEKVLKPLGANTEGSQFLKPDGNFPNHIPNPEDSDAMDSITKAVLNNSADLGIIFDTDVDRAAIVSKDGIQINKNALIAMISAIILEEHPGSTIVTDSITSDGLRNFIEGLGGVQHRFKRGYKNVINEAIRLNDAGVESHLAIETSGHAAIKENYFLDDGAYLVSKLLIKMANMNAEGEELINLINSLEHPVESKSFRLPIEEDDYKKFGEILLKDVRDYVVKKEGWVLPERNYEGVKVCFKGGWFLIRLSLHEPLVAINIESNIRGGSEKIIKELNEFFKSYSKLNIKSFK